MSEGRVATRRNGTSSPRSWSALSAQVPLGMAVISGSGSWVESLMSAIFFSKPGLSSSPDGAGRQVGLVEGQLAGLGAAGQAGQLVVAALDGKRVLGLGPVLERGHVACLDLEGHLRGPEALRRGGLGQAVDAVVEALEGEDVAAFALAGHLGRDRLEHRLVIAGVPVSLVDDVIDTGLVEGEHRVALELMVDADIPVIGEDFLGGTVGRGGQEGDRLHEEVHGGIQLVQLAVDGHVRADDDVRAQGLGDIDGEVVPHAAVQEHFAFLAHGAEVKRDGHRGTEGVRDAS